jgi:hypothetical protein
MKVVKIKWVILLVISYSLALVVLAPLQWLLPLVAPTLANLGVTLEEPDGNLWQGEALVRRKPYGFAKVDWDVQFVGLLALKLPVQVSLQNSQMAVTGLLLVKPAGVAVENVTGYLDDALFEPIYSAYKAKLSGRLQLDSVSAAIGWGKQLGALNGALTWSGGPVGIPMGRAVQNYQVPTLFGQLAADDQGWSLSVQGERQQTYMNMSLTPVGLAKLTVQRTLADDMAIGVPGNGTTLFDISQQVF